MKRILLLIGCGLLGYYVYNTWFAEPPPAPVVPVQAKAEKVDFAIKSRVRKLFEEWKRQQLASGAGQHGAVAANPDEERRQIRQLLFREGRYSDAAVGEVIARALREMGVAESELGTVLGGVMSVQQAAGAKKGGGDSSSR
ncbi:MAG: hypothetical protein ACKOKC_04355 [Chthoniobacterales bacterium]